MGAENVAAIIVLIMLFGIPIAAILTSHQRKMAELIHGKGQAGEFNHQVLAELQSLRAEVNAMRSQLNEQAIIVDDLRPLARQTPPQIEQRLSDVP